ncbi:MAG: RusA family crossover junction endodeoxyribonuclease [Pseudomonadota bacterium]|nr:RusA family crossover junction endodeoxyribonuclease [Pseudomonadota bacterium]
MPISFVIHGAPRGKGRPRFGVVRGRATAFTDKQTVAYERTIQSAARSVMATREPLDGPVWVRINIFIQIPVSAPKWKQAQMRDGSIRPTRTPDADNVAKAVLDGINGVVFADDKQVVGMGVTKFYSDHARVEVTVGEVSHG